MELNIKYQFIVLCCFGIDFSYLCIFS